MLREIKRTFELGNEDSIRLKIYNIYEGIRCVSKDKVGIYE